MALDQIPATSNSPTTNSATGSHKAKMFTNGSGSRW